MANAATTHRTAVLLASDIHSGRKTQSYNREVMRARFDNLSERLYQLRHSLPFEIDEFVLFLLGDVGDGQLIYPTQAFEQDETNGVFQMHRSAKLLTDFLVDQKATWGAARCEAVAGNHGRSGKYRNPNDNLDIAIYLLLGEMLRFSSVPVNCNINQDDDGMLRLEDTESPFLRVARIYDTGFLLHHGDNIRMYQTIPRYGIVETMKRWATVSRETIPDWRYLCLGHFHTAEYFPFNALECYMNGTMVTGDRWALERLRLESIPAWWFLLIRPDGEVDMQCRIRLDE